MGERELLETVPDGQEAAPGTGRLLLVPVPVAPTKPLTPSHIKGLLWMDVLRRATGLLRDVTLLYSHGVGVCNQQTLGFWAYLDRVCPDADFSELGEEQIGSLYVEFQGRRESLGSVDLRAYRDAVTRRAWLHPAGARIVDLWSDRLRELGVADPGLRGTPGRPVPFEELIAVLLRHGLCVDHRPWKGPVYLDCTRAGLPLRRIADADGLPNYLAVALCELLPLVGAYEEIVLACDREALPDYHLLRHVLTALGARVSLIAMGRVRLGGVVRSSRMGGWAGHTAAPLAQEFLPKVGPSVYRLGMRLYFVVVLGQGDREPFRRDLLWRCMARAERLIRATARPSGAEGDVEAFLRRHARPHAYVHPYRMTSALLARGRPVPRRALLEEVFT